MGKIVMQSFEYVILISVCRPLSLGTLDKAQVPKLLWKMLVEWACQQSALKKTKKKTKKPASNFILFDKILPISSLSFSFPINVRKAKCTQLLLIII